MKNQWNSNLYFLLAMIGSAIGIGNIWRFPYIFYSNGQGSFLIPYICAILILALPFMLLEYSLGFKYKTSFLKIFKKVNSKFQLVAWALAIVIVIIFSYYLCVVGWDVIYFVLSFFKGWGSDPNIFFSETLLHSTGSIDGLFSIIPSILIAILFVLFCTWFISHRDLNAGIGRVSKIFVPLIFIFIMSIVIFSLTLPGAYIGLLKFITPNWSCLLNPSIWISAFGQIVFSLSLGMGITLVYSSYLGEDTNLTRNILIVILSNCGFELINALGVFCILGYMVHSTGIPFDSLIKEGTGLAFIVFPQVFNIMGFAAYIIGPIFFFSIFIAGITSLISILEASISPFCEGFNISREKAITLICILCGFTSILFSTRLGSSFVTYFDLFVNNIALILIIILTCCIVSYGGLLDGLMDILNHKTIFTIGNWWKYILKFILPIILFILWLSGLFALLPSFNIFSIAIFVILTVVVISFSLIFYKFSKVEN